MIPENFKDILANVQNNGFYQTLALLLFMTLFGFLVYYVMSKPKNYYRKDAEAPLEDDTIQPTNKKY